MALQYLGELLKDPAYYQNGLIRDSLFMGKIQIYVMIMTGKWFKGFNNKTVNTIYKIYSFAVEWFFALMTFQILISIIVFRGCSARVVDLVSYYTQYTNLNICSFLSKKKSMRQCFNYIIDYNKSSSIILRYSDLNRRLIVFFIIFTCSVAFPWYVLGVRSTFDAEDSETCPVKKGLIYQIWYPFDLYNKCFVVTYILDVLLYIVVVITHVYNKITPVSFLVFVISQLKLLQRKLQTLEDNVAKLTEEHRIDYDEAVSREIINCVEEHQEIIRLMLLVERACKEIVLVNFFTNSSEVAAFAIYFLTEDTITGLLRVFVVLTLTVTQLLMTFWFANEILVESTAISDVIYYKIDWLNFDRQAKQLLLVMMIRAQKPLVIKLPGIGDMSIGVFTRIMKLCYSTITFFKTVYL